MIEKKKKTPEQLEAERIEIARLCDVLLEMTARCPKRVIDGSYQTAVQWKSTAISARRLAESKSPTILKLQNALTALGPFYS